MHDNQHPHPEQPSDDEWKPSWVPPQPPYYSATEPPQRPSTGNKVLVGVIVALVLVILVGLAGLFFFLSDPQRTASGSAQSTVVETITEIVDPPAGEEGAGQEATPPEPAAPSRPEYPQLPGNATAVSSEAAGGAPAGSFRNVYTGSGVTSSQFAVEVGNAYRNNYQRTGNLNATVSAHSPVTGTTYSMRCTDNGSYVTCAGGNNAVVYLS